MVLCVDTVNIAGEMSLYGNVFCKILSIDQTGWTLGSWYQYRWTDCYIGDTVYIDRLVSIYEYWCFLYAWVIEFVCVANFGKDLLWCEVSLIVKYVWQFRQWKQWPVVFNVLQ